LEKLQHNVDRADRVIAIIGDAFGYAFDEDQQQPVLPDGTPRRSYSQWEYYFALGERLDLEQRAWSTKQPRKDIYL
jgi:hypothetical protein